MHRRHAAWRPHSPETCSTSWGPMVRRRRSHMLLADPPVKQTVKIAAKFVTAERLKLLFAIPKDVLVLTREGTPP